VPVCVRAYVCSCALECVCALARLRLRVCEIFCAGVCAREFEIVFVFVCACVFAFVFVRACVIVHVHVCACVFEHVCVTGACVGVGVSARASVIAGVFRVFLCARAWVSVCLSVRVCFRVCVRACVCTLAIACVRGLLRV
jgi:hypothetical protein